MEIVTAPNASLRQKAEPIKELDKKTVQFIKTLGTTLEQKQDPPGVGLAGPQVNKKLRAFAIRPVKNRGDSVPIKVFINPHITDHSQDKALGAKEGEPDLEGCLSIPNVYGPVPRWTWVELDYQVLENQKLVDKSKRFSDFPARIVQHELDHLEGVLFTDYLLEMDLPAYLQEKDQLIELDDKSILKVY
jgi:peptide deformylase